MKVAERKDKAVVLHILHQAFADNPSVLHTTKSKGKKPEEIRHLLAYCFDICLHTGYILINEDHTSCALIRYPERKLPVWQQSVWDIRLLYNCIGLKNAMKVLQKERQLKKLYPGKAHHYLWYIGTLPAHSRQGKGSSILQEILTRASQKNCAVYLETSVDKNVRWYQKHGFEIYNQLQFDHPLFALRWLHKKPADN